MQNKYRCDLPKIKKIMKMTGFCKCISSLFMCKCKKIVFLLMPVIISTLLALGVWLYISIFNDSIISKFITTFPKQVYVNCFFSDLDAKSEKANLFFEDGSDIVLFEISEGYTSRGDIARILYKLSKMKPRLVLLDFYFANSVTYDSLRTDSLYNAIKVINDSTKLVVVADKNTDGISQSFFVNSLNVDYGVSDFVSCYEFVPYINDSIPRISTRAAELLGVDIKSFSYPIEINYRNRIFDNRHIENDATLDSLDPQLLRNKIVLLGQKDKGRDLHMLPFPIGGTNKVYGLDLIAYELSTLLTSTDGSIDERRTPFRYLSFVEDVVVYIIMVLLYFIMVELANLFRNNVYQLFFKPCLLLFFECLVIVICFFVTEKYMIIPDVGLYVLSVPFIGVFCESYKHLNK